MSKYKPEYFVEIIQNLKLTSSNVADALGKKGRVTKALPLHTSVRPVVGIVYHTAGIDGSNWLIHKQLANIEAGNIAYVENMGCNELAMFGGLVSEYVTKHRKAAAIVCDGNVRDVDEIKANNLPVWACGSNPVGCKQIKVTDSFQRRYTGNVMVCDSTGCVMIKIEEMNQELEHSLREMHKKEEEWFALMCGGKSTFEITCKG